MVTFLTSGDFSTHSASWLTTRQTFDHSTPRHRRPDIVAPARGTDGTDGPGASDGPDGLRPRGARPSVAPPATHGYYG